jgi:hypothetical protein
MKFKNSALSFKSSTYNDPKLIVINVLLIICLFRTSEPKNKTNRVINNFLTKEDF